MLDRGAVVLAGLAAACGIGPLAEVADTATTEASTSEVDDAGPVGSGSGGTTNATAESSAPSEATSSSEGGDTDSGTTSDGSAASTFGSSTGSGSASSSGTDERVDSDSSSTGGTQSTGILVETDSASVSISTTTSDDTTTWDDSTTTSGESSSSSGEEFATCYTELWSVPIAEVPYPLAPAVDADGLIFVAGTANGSEVWIGAWDLAGAAQWSKTIDPVELGLDEADGEAVDVDVLNDGDALLSYDHDSEAVYVRLDAATGDLVWASVLGAEELLAFDLGMGVQSGTALSAAITGSGRVFALGIASLWDVYAVWAGELDESSGQLLWTSELYSFGWDQFGVGSFLADDDTGLYLSYSVDSYGAPDWYSGVERISLSGEPENALGPDGLGWGGDESCDRLALDPQGDLALSCAWYESMEWPGEVIRFLERRAPDNTLLAGGFGETPELAGPLSFEADGDLVVADYPSLYRLDPDLDILSADDLDFSPRGITALPDDDLILGGSLDGMGLLRRYSGCP